MTKPSTEDNMPSNAIIPIKRSVASIIMGQSILKKLFGTAMGVIKIVMARTKARFAMLEPTTFPNAMSE